MERRDFLKRLSIISSALVIDSRNIFPRDYNSVYFGMHDFIESNPDAVFIFRTSIDSKANSAAIKDAGRLLSSSIFQLKTDPLSGYPVDANVVIKPNITYWSWDIAPIESIMGIHTDPNFVEGMIGSLNNLSINSDKIYIREANYHGAASVDGKPWADMAARTNINIKDVSTGLGSVSQDDIQWRDVNNGTWFKKIPFIWPTNSDNSCLINISKFKSHAMGMSLCSKNIQGSVIKPYVTHCASFNAEIAGMDASHIVPGAFDTIRANYELHKSKGIPRWLLPGDGSGGIWMETWASRCIDNNSTLKPMINIIEGIYGREGAFVAGPVNGYGNDVLSNVIIFGKNAFHVDIVGTYLSGHEPGNFGLFHMAKERGLSKYLNPNNVPVYEWKSDGTAAVKAITDFQRTPIRTPYLQLAGEAQYHMVDQPFDYSTTSAQPVVKPMIPEVFAISQNYPNPFNPSTSIRYYIPNAGQVLIEIYDIKGSRIAVLVDGSMNAGEHLSVWNSNSAASGTYIYRMTFQGHSISKAMVLLR